MKNFTLADRKRNMADFGLVPPSWNLSWIEDNSGLVTTTYTVAYSATPVFELSNGGIQTIALTGNVTSSVITYHGSATVTDGLRITLRICQDATGGWTFVMPTNVRSDPEYAIDTTANTATIIELQSIGNKWEYLASPVIIPLS